MIVIVRNFGQLGNRLLLSAHLIAAAREYGVTLVNPAFAEYARFFPSTAGDLWCRYPVVEKTHRGTPTPPNDSLRRAAYQAVYLAGKASWYAKQVGVPVPMIRLRGEQLCDLASDTFRDLAQSRRPLLVSGWKFRSVTLFEKHADAIRDHYQIMPQHRDRVTALMEQVRRNAEVVIGVHIRHGDYATFEGGKYFYSLQQYVEAMRRIQDQMPSRNVAFLVCGNTSLDKRDFGDLNVHFGTGHLIEDMYAFAETDLIVGPPSTYTAWSSFYGRVPLQFMKTASQPFDLSSILAVSSHSHAA